MSYVGAIMSIQEIRDNLFTAMKERIDGTISNYGKYWFRYHRIPLTIRIRDNTLIVSIYDINLCASNREQALNIPDTIYKLLSNK